MGELRHAGPLTPSQPHRSAACLLDAGVAAGEATAQGGRGGPSGSPGEAAKGTQRRVWCPDRHPGRAYGG